MVHGVSALLAATQALDAPHGLGGTPLVAAILFTFLSVASMFWLLFWTNWGHPIDPTDVLEQRRRRRFAASEQRAA